MPMGMTIILHVVPGGEKTERGDVIKGFRGTELRWGRVCCGPSPPPLPGIEALLFSNPAQCLRALTLITSHLRAVSYRGNHFTVTFIVSLSVSVESVRERDNGRDLPPRTTSLHAGDVTQSETATLSTTATELISIYKLFVSVWRGGGGRRSREGGKERRRKSTG